MSQYNKEYHRHASIEWYKNNKEKANFVRHKNLHKQELGNEIIETIYAFYNNDYEQIKNVIAFLKAQNKVNEMIDKIPQQLQTIIKVVRV